MLPVIMVTSSIGQEKTRRSRPARTTSSPSRSTTTSCSPVSARCLRIKRYHDEIKELNRTLEQRVQDQVEELERLRRLQRFLSPQLADAIVDLR